MGIQQLEPLLKRIPILMVGIAILILSFLVPWDMFLPPWNVIQRSSWKISPQVVGVVSHSLLWGTTVHGTISCYGANDDIDFRITDSRNHIVFNAGRIYNGYEFRWQTWGNDMYQYKFDNTISTFTTKDVGYLIYSYYYFHIFFLIGSVITIIGLILIINETIKKPHSART